MAGDVAGDVAGAVMGSAVDPTIAGRTGAGTLGSGEEEEACTGADPTGF